MPKFILPGLSLQPDKKVILPTGGEGFKPGLVGKWSAAFLYVAQSMTEYSKEELPYIRRAKHGDGYKYYFRADEWDAANRVSRERDKRFGPEQWWRFEALFEDIVFPSDEVKEKFNKNFDGTPRESFTYEGQVYSTLSKRRHGFHMIMLPCFVSAMAQLDGADAPEFDISELTAQGVSYTDKFQNSLIGFTTASKDDRRQFAELVGAYVEQNKSQELAISLAREEYPRPPYQYSILWQRRAALWSALGEPDPQKYVYQTGNKLDTMSDVLGPIVANLQQEWPQPFWMRVASVPNPDNAESWTVKGEGGDDRQARRSIPAVMEIFRDEAHARTMVGTATPTNTPSVPGGMWDGVPNKETEWPKAVKDNADTPLVLAAKQLGVSNEVLLEWRVHLGVNA